MLMQWVCNVETEASAIIDYLRCSFVDIGILLNLAGLNLSLLTSSIPLLLKGHPKGHLNVHNRHREATTDELILLCVDKSTEVLCILSDADRPLFYIQIPRPIPEVEKPTDNHLEER